MAASEELTFLFEGVFGHGPSDMLTSFRKRRVPQTNARAYALLCYEHDQPVGQRFKDVADPTDEQWDVALFYDTVALTRPDSILGYLGPAVGRMTGSDPDELAWVSAFEHILQGDLGGGVREARAAASCRRSLLPRHWHKVGSRIHLKKVTR